MEGKEVCKTFYTSHAIFVSKNKICRIKEQTKELEIFNYELEDSSHTIQGVPGLIEKIFAGTIGKVIIVTEEQIVLYDINAKKIINAISVTAEFANLKFVSWNRNNSIVALVCKKNIHLMTKTLHKICSISEKFNIKSIFWTKENAFIYATVNHIKFGLLNGESGIIKCCDQQQRIINFENNDLTLIDINGKISVSQIDNEELMLKLALYDKNWEKTKFYMNNMKKLGNSVVAYLYKKNYSALALNLVEDKKAKFSLSIDCGNLEVAYRTCNDLKDKDLYK